MKSCEVVKKISNLTTIVYICSPQRSKIKNYVINVGLCRGDI